MPSLADFEASLHDPDPLPGLTPALVALWWVRKPDWDRAHDTAQHHEGDPACDWVHAHLHRVEGDLANAAYWYRQSGKPVSAAALADEWHEIAASFTLAPPQGSR